MVEDRRHGGREKGEGKMKVSISSEQNGWEHKDENDSWKWSYQIGANLKVWEEEPVEWARLKVQERGNNWWSKGPKGARGRADCGGKSELILFQEQKWKSLSRVQNPWDFPLTARWGPIPLHCVQSNCVFPIQHVRSLDLLDRTPESPQQHCIRASQDTQPYVWQNLFKCMHYKKYTPKFTKRDL